MVTESGFIEFCDDRPYIHQVLRLPSQHLNDMHFASHSYRAVRIATEVFVQYVVARMPYPIAIHSNAINDRVTIYMPEPPGEHRGRDVSDDLMLDPAVQAPIRKIIDAGSGRTYGFMDPVDRERGWRVLAHNRDLHSGRC